MAELVIKRVSLLSIETEVETRKETKTSESLPVPPDKFYFTHILSVLLGLAMLLPMVFFTNANQYWMYKFRDTSPGAIDDADHRTMLQSNFVSVQGMVQAVASIICGFLIIPYGHKLPIKTRLLSSLSLLLICFIVFTIFVKVKTDTWQTGFFILTMVILVITTGVGQVLQFTTMSAIPKLPPQYMKSFIYGQALSAIVSALLQIISLAIGGSPEFSALNYFVFGSFLIGVAFLCSFLSQYSAFYQHFCFDAPEISKKKPHTIADIKETVAYIWPCMLILVLFIISVNTAHPTVTSLVVSEYQDTGNEWNKTYFVPVITFLYSSLLDLVGRYSQTFLPKITKSNAKYFVIIAIVKTIVLSPMIWLCNAKPRHHLPVVFNHDWQYILIIGIFSIINGYFFMTGISGIEVLGANNQGLSYLLIQASLGIIGSLVSPLGIAVVNSL